MAQIVLLAFALIMILGGVMGQRAGSKVSLYAGAGSGVVLLLAFWISRTSPVGVWIGIVVGLALAASFGMRLAKTGKLMPAGALLGVSVVCVALLIYSIV